jgi:hypothetical protein
VDLEALISLKLVWKCPEVSGQSARQESMLVLRLALQEAMLVLKLVLQEACYPQEALDGLMPSSVAPGHNMEEVLASIS